VHVRLLLYASVVLFLTSPLTGGETKAILLPDYVLDAKTVAAIVDPDAPVSASHPNDNKQAADAVEQALMKWGRYKLVASPQSADLVILIRKGRSPGAVVSGAGNGSDRPVILQQPTDHDTRAVVQWGTPPPLSTPQQQPQQAPQQQRRPEVGTEAGTTEDMFELFQGQEWYPLEGAPLWTYAGKNALDAPKVTAVEQFRKAVAAAEKARK